MKTKNLIQVLDDSTTSRGWIGREKEFGVIRALILHRPMVTREELIRASYAVIDEGIGPVIDEVIVVLRSRGVNVEEGK